MRSCFSSRATCPGSFQQPHPSDTDNAPARKEQPGILDPVLLARPGRAMRGTTVGLDDERLLAPNKIALIAFDVNVHPRPVDPMLVA